MSTETTNIETEKQLAPELRFKEFDEEWDKDKVGNIAKVTAGGTPSTLKTEYWGGDIRWMNSGDLNLKRVYEVKNRITEVGLKNSSTKIIPVNSILIGLAGQGKTRGTAAINLVELCTNQSIAAILPSDNFESEFLYQNIDGRYEELRRLSTGDGGRGGLNLQIIKGFYVPIPSLPEQQKIASFLSAVDEKIQQLTKKKELLEQYKKGVMQQLFSGQLRFKDENGKEYPDWEEKRLGTIAEIVGGGTPETVKPEYWDGEIQWFTPTEIRTKYISNSKRTITQSGLSKSSAKLLPFGTILFTSRATIAELGFATQECTTNQGFQSLIVNEDNVSEFVYQLIKINKNEFVRKSQGSTFLEISSKEMKKMKFSVPSKPEQQKIATYLSSIDTKIESVNDKITQTQSFKKGLLQQMFV